jgi:hypothetical protein
MSGGGGGGGGGYQCIITGCALIQEESWAWGDLFQDDSCNFTFLGASPNHQWTEHSGGKVKGEEEKALILQGNVTYWHRRGVTVIPFTSGYLNRNAVAYITKGR